MERGVQILSARWRQAFRMEVKYKSESGSQLNREYGDIGHEDYIYFCLLNTLVACVHLSYYYFFLFILG